MDKKIDQQQCDENVLLRQATFLRQFLADIHEDTPVYEKPCPSLYKPLRFNKENRVDLVDIEQMIEGYLMALYPAEFVFGLRTMFETIFPRMRLYEYLIQICRYAEEKYTESSKFFQPIIFKWKQVAAKSEGDVDIQELIEIFPNGVEQQQIERWSGRVEEIKVDCLKLAEIFYQTSKFLHIPKVTDGCPLRLIISILYTLILDRLDVIEKFINTIEQIKCIKTGSESVTIG